MVCGLDLDHGLHVTSPYFIHISFSMIRFHYSHDICLFYNFPILESWYEYLKKSRYILCWVILGLLEFMHTLFEKKNMQGNFGLKTCFLIKKKDDFWQEVENALMWENTKLIFVNL